jgi:hypothetical protein
MNSLTILFTYVLSLYLQFSTAHPSSTLFPEKRSEQLRFDISTAQSKSFFTCMRSNGYKKVAIRIYQQACGVGVSFSVGWQEFQLTNFKGEIDKAFLTSYNNAKDAGFSTPSEIDAYMFPCLFH